MALSDVIVEIGTDCKLSIASFDITGKRFHAHVKSQMLPEMRRLRVGFATFLAKEFTITRWRLMNTAASSAWGRFRDSLGCCCFNLSFLWFLQVFLLEVLNQLCYFCEAHETLFTGQAQLIVQRFDAWEEVTFSVTINDKISSSLKKTSSSTLTDGR